MDLLYYKKHINCINYDNSPQSIISIIKIGCDIDYEEQPLLGTIAFLLEGEITFSFAAYINCHMQEGQMLYLPVDYKFVYKTTSKATLLFVRMSQKIQICDQYFIEGLVNYSAKDRSSTSFVFEKLPYMLQINSTLKEYLNHLFYCIQRGLKCKYYFEIKVKELFFLLGSFYLKEELGFFFKEALSCDPNFSHFVILNYHKYNSLSDLAGAANMSLSNIEKHFKKVFGISGYKWMTEQKTKKIFHAICTSQANFKEISDEFGFASKSTFNDYCKKHLGKTPGEIRRKISSRQFEEQMDKN